MEKDKTAYHIPFQVPSFARPAAYTFAESETQEIYQELAAISEEIEQCRLRNLPN